VHPVKQASLSKPRTVHRRMTAQRRLRRKYAPTKQAAESALVKGVFAEAWTGDSIAEGFYRI